MSEKHTQSNDEVTDDLHIEVGPFKFRRTKRWLTATALAAVAVASVNHSHMHLLPDVAASGEQGELFREVTGEDILRMTERVGGTLVSAPVYDPETGLITEIHASIPFEYDYEEASEVLESLQAAGVAPKKLLGDLAQTSVIVNGQQTQIISLAEWSLSWKRKTAEATTTDDAEYESSVGSTKSWSVKAKYMFLDGDTTQETYVIGAINALQNDANLWNFFPTVEQGRDAFQGYAIIDGIDFQTGMGKCCGLDISLKGTGALTLLKQSAPVANANTVTGQSAQVPVATS